MASRAGPGRGGEARRTASAREGAVSVVVSDGNGAAIVALECETDFVAKSAEFVRLVDDLADSSSPPGR